MCATGTFQVFPPGIPCPPPPPHSPPLVGWGGTPPLLVTPSMPPPILTSTPSSILFLVHLLLLELGTAAAPWRAVTLARYYQAWEGTPVKLSPGVPPLGLYLSLGAIIYTPPPPLTIEGCRCISPLWASPSSCRALEGEWGGVLCCPRRQIWLHMGDPWKHYCSPPHSPLSPR